MRLLFGKPGFAVDVGETDGGAITGTAPDATGGEGGSGEGGRNPATVFTELIPLYTRAG